MSSLDINELVDQIEKTLNKKLGKKYKKALEKNLLEVFKTKGKKYILDAFVKQYDILASQEQSEFGSGVQGKDPSELTKFRHLFVKQISDEIDRMKIQGNSLVIDVGDIDLWYPPGGLDGELVGDPETVDFLGFYLEGNIDEFAFITMEQYKAMRPHRKQLYGRFGKGFLIPKEAYIRERWEERTKLKFEQVRHPISGQSPFKGFDQISNILDFTPLVQEAVEKTFEELFR